MIYIILGMALLCILIILAILLWDKPVILIYSNIFFCCILYVFITYFQIPDKIKYLSDAINLYVFCLAILKYRAYAGKMQLMFPVVCIAIFFASTMVSFYLNDGEIPLYIWGAHILLRFYLFFFSCSIFLGKEDVERIFNLFLVLLGANVLLVSYQYFVQGLTDDHVGGLFGILQGSNGQMNMFLVILVAYVFAKYLVKKIPISTLIYVLIGVVYIAAVSELKALFFEVPLIGVITVLCNKPNKKTFTILIGGILGCYLAIQIFLLLYPGWKDFFQAENLNKYLGDDSYGQDGSLNRLSAIPYMYKHFLTQIPQRIVGIGLGNADTSMLGESIFYHKNMALRYYWFSYAKLFTENGIFGLFAYYSFFAAVAYKSWKIKQQIKDADEYCIMTIALAVMAVVMSIYNNSMSLEISYLLYFSLSIPFMMNKEELQKGRTIYGQQSIKTASAYGT